MTNKNRLKKLEEKIDVNEDKITEIIIDFIDIDGKVSSTMKINTDKSKSQSIIL